MDKEVAYLKMIQDVITGMNKCSFLIKGWMVTIVSAMIALFARQGSNRQVLYCAIPIAVFWLLDAYYLCQERRFRCLYNEKVAEYNDNAEKIPTALFDMDTSSCKDIHRWKYNYFASLISITALLTYGILLIVIVLIAIR